MIDWVTAYVPCANLDPDKLQDGSIFDISSTGKVNWEFLKPLKLIGSHESSIRVGYCSVDGYSHLRIDGNPIKFLQGHNLFGSSDLIPLVYKVVERIVDALKLMPDSINRKDWENGNYKLNRVDCTEMWKMPSNADVLSWLSTAQFQARSRHGKPIMTGGTLYFGKNSRRWAVKFYSKSDELSHNNRKLPGYLPHRYELLEFSLNMLRAELTLRSPALDSLNMRKACKWDSLTPYKLLKSYIDKIEMADQFQLTDKTLSRLPRNLMTAYRLWLSDHEMRAMYSQSTFYRKRRELLKYGIDISLKHVEKPDDTLSLKSVFDYEHAQVPEWAKGTELFFEPTIWKGIDAEETDGASAPVADAEMPF